MKAWHRIALFAACLVLPFLARLPGLFASDSDWLGAYVRSGLLRDATWASSFCIAILILVQGLSSVPRRALLLACGLPLAVAAAAYGTQPVEDRFAATMAAVRTTWIACGLSMMVWLLGWLRNTTPRDERRRFANASVIVLAVTIGAACAYLEQVSSRAHAALVHTLRREGLSLPLPEPTSPSIQAAEPARDSTLSETLCALAFQGHYQSRVLADCHARGAARGVRACHHVAYRSVHDRALQLAVEQCTHAR